MESQPVNAPESFSGKSLTASLTVSDMQRSIDWYHGVVGFGIEQRYERDGKLLAVTFKAGDVRLLITQDDGARGADRAKGEGISLMVTTSDPVDAIAERIKAKGGSLETEPADMPWGARAFRVKDPDGFKFAISSERRRP
jgi:uncharacterized glyoxalase superfamily protein PhnB